MTSKEISGLNVGDIVKVDFADLFDLHSVYAQILETKADVARVRPFEFEEGVIKYDSHTKWIPYFVLTLQSSNESVGLNSTLIKEKNSIGCK